MLRDLLPSWEVAGLSNSSGGTTMPRRHKGGADATLRRTQPYEPSALPIFWVAGWQGVREVWTMKEERFYILTCPLATGRIL
jgi:hypothetical protein